MNDGDIEIERRDRVTHGEYIATASGAAAKAKLTWTAADGTEIRSADHTFVPPAMRGKGIAAGLVKALVDDARKGGFRIRPACSYVAAQFKRHPEWSDLQA